MDSIAQRYAYSIHQSFLNIDFQKNFGNCPEYLSFKGGIHHKKLTEFIP